MVIELGLILINSLFWKFYGIEIKSAVFRNKCKEIIFLDVNVEREKMVVSLRLRMIVENENKKDKIS